MRSRGGIYDASGSILAANMLDRGEAAGIVPANQCIGGRCTLHASDPGSRRGWQSEISRAPMRALHTVKGAVLFKTWTKGLESGIYAHVSMCIIKSEL